MPVPCVKVYSAQDTKLSLDNGGAFFTAFVVAPYMDVSIKTMNAAYDSAIERCYYDGILLSDVKKGDDGKGGMQRLFCIGCFDVHALEGQNNLTVLYINENDSGEEIKKAANGKFSYAAVDYDAY